jgi:N-carbamoyl-L-amino-acid hydrolase
MMQRICPTAIIFVPSVAGLSHNVKEHTEPLDLVAGAQVLANMLLELASE